MQICGQGLVGWGRDHKRIITVLVEDAEPHKSKSKQCQCTNVHEKLILILIVQIKTRSWETRSQRFSAFVPSTTKSWLLNTTLLSQRDGAAEVTGGHIGDLMDASFYCGCQFVACKSIPNVPKSVSTATSIPFYCPGRKKILICRGIWQQIFCLFPSRSRSLSSSGLLRWCSDTHPAQNKQFQILLSQQTAQHPNKYELHLIFFHLCQEENHKSKCDHRDLHLWGLFYLWMLRLLWDYSSCVFI